MQPEDLSADIRASWQNQPPMTALTSTLLRRTALRFERKSRAIVVVGLAGHVVYALFFLAAAWFGDVTLCRIGCALIASGFCYSAYNQRAFWEHLVFPSDCSSDCSKFYRRLLTERRDFLRNGMLFFVPSTYVGVALACLGWILSAPQHWQEAAGLALFYVGLHFAVHQLNAIEVARLQKELALLDLV
jgi:hypothetical protein